MTSNANPTPRALQARKNRKTGALLVGVILFLVGFSILFVKVINPRIHRGVPASTKSAVRGNPPNAVPAP